METILDALKAMGKATAREIAARLDIESRDALDLLNEERERGRVELLNGYWSLSSVAKKKTAKAPAAPKESVAKTGEKQLTDAIREHGPQKIEGLKKLTGILPRNALPILAVALREGRLVRVKEGNQYLYCLPEAKTQAVVAEEPVAEAMPVPEADNATQPESLPPQQKTVATDVMEIPSPCAVAKIVRRNKARLARLQKTRSAALAARRNGLQVRPEPKEIVREIRRLTAIVEAGTKLSSAVSTAKKCLSRINRYDN
ncbi:hypothetical protein DPO11_22930 [Salmonella enterica]|nr:hypothetical protein [Salmonella enterica]